MAKAVSAGYTQGYGDGTFRPDKDITRAEAATMIAKATGLTAQESYADGFSDEIPAWAKGSVGAVAAAGFMIGHTDGTFGADDTITRAAAVVALDRVAAKAQGTVTITEPDTTLEDKIIAGDLIVAESVGDGNVYLKNVTVAGNTYIKGGGSHSFYAENSKFSGTVYMQKDRLHMGLSGSTEMQQVQMEKPSSITFEKSFSGSVKNLNIPKDATEGKYAIEAEDKTTNPIENMSVDSKMELSLGANVSKMTVGENAKDSSITVEKDATVENMKVNSKTEITGKGTVGNMDVGASGVTTDQELTVKDTTTSNGAAAPTTKPGSNFSYISTGSSTPPAERTDVTIAFKEHNYNTTTAKYVSFDVTGATLAREDLFVTVTSKAAEASASTELTEGSNYKIEISGGTITVTFLAFQGDTAYTVELKASSVGSGKYNITPCTYRYDGLNKVTWTANTTNTANIFPGTKITEDKASVTFTVDGATINGGSEAITAKLKGSAAGSAESNVTKIAISNDKKSITVDLAEQTLPADTYTLTLSVPNSRLENTSSNRYVPETSTATATFTVNTRPVELGGGRTYNSLSNLHPTKRFPQVRIFPSR